MRISISATEAARNFSELLNRVRYQHEHFVVERNGRPVCEVLPAEPASFNGADLVQLLRSIPKPDKGYLDAVEQVIGKQPPVAQSQWER